jgi:hypothetical protein
VATSIVVKVKSKVTYGGDQVFLLVDRRDIRTIGFLANNL